MVWIDCPPTPCWLPALLALQTNDDWRAAVDALEGELLSCAGRCWSASSGSGCRHFLSRMRRLLGEVDCLSLKVMTGKSRPEAAV